MTAKDRNLWQRRARGASLRLVMEGEPNAQQTLYAEDRKAVRSPKDVVEVMMPLAEREPAEVFWVLALDSQHRLIGNAPIEVTRGILNSSLVHPREVFRGAIVAGAAALILCHNHPSGDCTPSADDRMVTEQLAAAGRLLDMPIHDHIILGANAHTSRYTSFAEAGLL